MAEHLEKIEIPKTKGWKLVEEKINRILCLTVEVHDASYNKAGRRLRRREAGEELGTPPYLAGIFNHNLLDEEYMDAQPYTGEPLSSGSDSS